MNIGIDYDDVIVDTYESYFAYAQKYTIEKLKKEPIIIDDGDIESSSYCTFMHRWTQAEEDDFWYNNYVEEILKNAKPKTFAKEVIKKLREDGNKVIIITSRNGIEENITYEQLREEEIIVDKVIVAAEEKGKIAKENNIDVFIDDNYKHCKSVEKEGITSYIMDIRSNRNIKDENIKRLYSWPHLYYEISKL